MHLGCAQFQQAMCAVGVGCQRKGLQGGLPALRYPVSAPSAAGWPAGEMRLQPASLLRQAHGASRVTVDELAQRSPGIRHNHFSEFICGEMQLSSPQLDYVPPRRGAS